MTHRCRNAPAVATRFGWVPKKLSLVLLLIGLCGTGGTLGAQAAVPEDPVDRSRPGPKAPDSAPTPWYRSTWAWATYGGIISGVAIFLWMRKRTVSLKRQRDELRRKRDEQAEKTARQTHEREQQVRELGRINETLRETVQEKATLLEAVAHDLKNPLFAIYALSDIVLENEVLSPPVRRKIGLIRQSAADGQDLIDDLLSSAADVHETERDTSIVDVGDLVHWVVQRFEPHADWKDQHLHCTVKASDPCLVDGNRRRLREALSNLLSNALKYSPPEARIDVILERTGDDVRIAVVDEGSGLSNEEQQRLFAPFQRLSPQPTGGESASGLGLYLVKQIVDRHHGRVDVDSSPGEGSTFTLVLPASKAPPIGHTQGELLSSAVPE